MLIIWKDTSGVRLYNFVILKFFMGTFPFCGNVPINWEINSELNNESVI